MNPNAIHLLEQNPTRIRWIELLLFNPNALGLIEPKLAEAIPGILMSGGHDAIWGLLSQNPGAIHLLEANPDKIDWNSLSSNCNAINLLAANTDKINWSRLSLNPNAIHLLEQHPDKINWKEMDCIWANPEIFDGWEVPVLK